MEQKRLYRTIDIIASKKFNTTKELISEVLNEVINDPENKIIGGRVWELSTTDEAYKLIYQTGKLEKIEDGFSLKISENPSFSLIEKERTILTFETNEILKEKGILKYSASGLGDKIKVSGKYYYKYLLAVNSAEIDNNLLYILNILATVLTSKIRERKLEFRQKNLISHIDKAKQLQRSILPDHEYEFHDYNIFGVTVPAQIISGDFFDYIKIGAGEERLGIVVGDAASKGLAAAAEAMYISGAMRMASTFQIKISPLMSRMNNLVNKIFSDDRFASLFYGEISDDEKGLCLYANAGHNWPIFISAKDKKLSYLKGTGPLLGPTPKSKYETHSINFNPGDVLVIYSDGIVEAANQNYDFYEEKRLEQVILENMHHTPREIALQILDDVAKFSTLESQYQDDKTIVVIKKNE